jgi:hypothetical protein
MATEEVWLEEEPRFVERMLPSRVAVNTAWVGEPPLLDVPDWIVVLRCGAGRHRHPPRVGEISSGGTMVMRTYAGAFDRRPVLLSGEYVDSGPNPPSLRFPCRCRIEGGRRCKADWNVDTSCLQAAYHQAEAERRRELVLGVDL